MRILWLLGVVAFITLFVLMTKALPPSPTPPTPPAGYTPPPGFTPPPFVKHSPFPQQHAPSVPKAPAVAPKYAVASDDQKVFLKAMLDKKVKAGKMSQQQEDSAMAHADAVYDAVMKEMNGKKKGAK